MQPDVRTNYWETVKQCLRQLLGFTVGQADTSVTEYKKEVETDHTENALYHEEPYEIACEIAGVKCDYDGQWADYQDIRAKFLPANSSYRAPTHSAKTMSISPNCFW